MKHKFLLSAMLLLFIVGLYIPASYSQNPFIIMSTINQIIEKNIKAKPVPNIIYSFVYLLCLQCLQNVFIGAYYCSPRSFRSLSISLITVKASSS